MNEESSVTYNDGDIVWVKLGPCWWPGEVKDKDKLPPEVVDFKKPPLVIVKFFDEDTYEYVRNWNNIYPYNCDKKNEFIKKGMGAYRSKVPHMEKFPKDVSNAEIVIGGNPNILSEPMFLPEKKRNYVAEIFGTPSPKGKSKEKKNRSKEDQDISHVTHRRFIGFDDYKAFVCIQYPGKDRISGNDEDEEIVLINQEPERQYNCHTCPFTTRRLEVLMLHTKSHIQGEYVPSSGKKRSTVFRPKKEKTKKPKTKTKPSHMHSEPCSSQDDTFESPKEKKRKVKQTNEKSVISGAPKTAVDIRSNLLAEWEDSDEEQDNTIHSQEMSTDLSINTTVDMIEDGANESQPLENELNFSTDETLKPDGATSNELLKNGKDMKMNTEETSDNLVVEPKSKADETNDNLSAEEESKIDEKKKPGDKIEDNVCDIENTSMKHEDKQKVEVQQAIKSCFDFDEDEEDEHAVIPTVATGRKIPRVIPITERKKSTDFENVDSVGEQILETDTDCNQQEDGSEKQIGRNDLEDAFKELMEMTEVPELPEVQNTLKCEQNFHCTRTIKFPDKQEFAGNRAPNIENKEDLSKELTNPKKRFVKSFETNRTKKERNEETAVKRNDPQELNITSLPEIAKLKTKIMSQIVEESNMNENVKQKIMSKMKDSVARELNEKTRDQLGIDVSVKELKSPVGSAPSESQKIGPNLPKLLEESDVDNFKTSTKIVTEEPMRSSILKKNKLTDEVRRVIFGTPMKDIKLKHKMVLSYTSSKTKSEAEEDTTTETPQSDVLNVSTISDFFKCKGEEISSKPLQLEIKTPEKSLESEILREKQKEILPPKKNKWSRQLNHCKTETCQNDFKEIPASTTTHSQTTAEETNNKLIDFVENRSVETVNDGENSGKDFLGTNSADRTCEENKSNFHVSNASDFSCENLESAGSISDIFSKENTLNLNMEIDLNSDIHLTKHTQDDFMDQQSPISIKESLSEHIDENIDIEEQSKLKEIAEQNSETFCSTNDFSLPSKEEFSPVEKACEFLPDDAICSPPRRNKKRKHSKSSAKDDSELTVQDFCFLEKRKKATEEREFSSELLPLQQKPETELTNLSNTSITEVQSDIIEEVSSITKNIEETEKVHNKEEKMQENNSEIFQEIAVDSIEEKLDQIVALSANVINVQEATIAEEDTVEKKLDQKGELSTNVHETTVTEEDSGEGKVELSTNIHETTTTEKDSVEEKLDKQVDLSTNKRERTITEEDSVEGNLDKQVELPTNIHAEVSVEGKLDKQVELSTNIHETTITEEDSAEGNFNKQVESPTNIHEEVSVEGKLDKQVELSTNIHETTISEENAVERNLDEQVELSTNMHEKDSVEGKLDKQVELSTTITEEDSLEGKLDKQVELSTNIHKTTITEEDAVEGKFDKQVELSTNLQKTTLTEEDSAEGKLDKTIELSTNITEDLMEGKIEQKVELLSNETTLAKENSVSTETTPIPQSVDETKVEMEDLVDNKKDLSEEQKDHIEFKLPIHEKNITEVISFKDKTVGDNTLPESLLTESETLQDKSDTSLDIVEDNDLKETVNNGTLNSSHGNMSSQCNEGQKSVGLVEDKIDEMMLSGEKALNKGLPEESVHDECKKKISGDSIHFEEADKKNSEELTTFESNVKIEERGNCEKGTAGETPDHHNKVEVECFDKNSSDAFKFSIQTNLSNFSSREEISAIALATLRETKSDSGDTSDRSKTHLAEKTEVTAVQAHPSSEPELVPIEGNLTVVSEKDLVDAQVEITDQVISLRKQPVLSSYSAEFSDSTSDSTSTNDTLGDTLKMFDSQGTEFTSKAITKDFKSGIGNKKGNTYERFELLDILEGNSDLEMKNKEFHSTKKAIDDTFCDFEDHIPPQIVSKNLKQEVEQMREETLKSDVGKRNDNRKGWHAKEKSNKSSIISTTSKLLERLTEHRSDKIDVGREKKEPKSNKTRGSKSKFASIGKSLIPSEQIIQSSGTESTNSVNKLRQSIKNIEDVKAFVIQKEFKHSQENTSLKPTIDVKALKSSKSVGKAKILQQTIITPSGEIIQPAASTTQNDDNIFDINSMPIVLSDEILTPESIENMPIVISNEPAISNVLKQEKVLITPTGKATTRGKIIAKLATTTATPPALVSQALIKKTTSIISKQNKITPRVLQNAGNKVLKQPILSSTSKPGKYIIVPQSSTLPLIPKAVTKRTSAPKKSTITAGIVTSNPVEITGNKIMIVTNQQGQQQRLLLTPAQQKMLGYHNAGTKITKTIVKGNILPKTVVHGISSSVSETSVINPVDKSSSSVGQKIIVSSSGTTIASSTNLLVGTSGLSQISRVIKGGNNKKLQLVTQKTVPNSKNQRTILIKNQHGHVVKKMQSSEEDLDKQVAEQLEAIRASSGIQLGIQTKLPELITTPKTSTKKPYVRKSEVKIKTASSVTDPQALHTIETSLPSVSTENYESGKLLSEQKITINLPTVTIPEPKPERPLNQLVIQDAVGNQTTITEGQILALPSETVDGQPQSYMLVTLDESGNLTPLNNEALMSLDPNLTGDLSNMVLQIEPNAVQQPLTQSAIVKTNKMSEQQKIRDTETVERQIEVNTEPSLKPADVPLAMKLKETVVEIPEPTQIMRSTIPSTNSDSGQQLIISGDPIATQKFLESLSEGTTDLANLLANADGNSILIQADGQQILINANSENLLSANDDNISESGSNPIFAAKPTKSQDILAAALADTDVFQQDQPLQQTKLTSQLSPNNTLFPINVGAVLETSLTLGSPIMTPLEVPSITNKKIPDDETDILTHVPKNVDLPITITDPNISQTVANQQVTSLLGTEIPTNLEITLPICDITKGDHPPYTKYSLDGSIDMSRKPFNSSMPILNEDVVEGFNSLKTSESLTENIHTKTIEQSAEVLSLKKGDNSITQEDDEDQYTLNREISKSLSEAAVPEEDEDGRYTLGGEICSSLSEPPPEMFDLTGVNESYIKNEASLHSTPDVSSKDDDTTDLSTLAESSNDSCEIPVQPQIITKSRNLEAFTSE